MMCCSLASGANKYGTIPLSDVANVSVILCEPYTILFTSQVLQKCKQTVLEIHAMQEPGRKIETSSPLLGWGPAPSSSPALHTALSAPASSTAPAVMCGLLPACNKWSLHLSRSPASSCNPHDTSETCFRTEGSHPSRCGLLAYSCFQGSSSKVHQRGEHRGMLRAISQV